MSIEQRLRDALNDKATKTEVDVAAQYAATQRRIGGSPRRSRATMLVAASAVAVLGIAGGGLWLDGQYDGGGDYGPAGQTWGSSQGAPVDRAVEGRVDANFTCPHQMILTDYMHRETFGGGKDLGVGHLGAERYQLIPHGDKALMRVGKADGTLTAKIHLVDRRGWVLEKVERCTGPEGSDVPAGGRFELGAHGRTMPDPPRPPAEYYPQPTSSVQAIDDRLFYNRIGVVDHRTYYAYETRKGALLAQVEYELGGRSFGNYATFGSSRPFDEGWNFIDEYGRMAFQSDFVFVLYYAKDTANLTAKLTNGDTVDAKVVSGDDWDGTLYALLAPRQEVANVVLERDGRTKTYRPDQL